MILHYYIAFFLKEQDIKKPMIQLKRYNDIYQYYTELELLCDFIRRL